MEFEKHLGKFLIEKFDDDAIEKSGSPVAENHEKEVFLFHESQSKDQRIVDSVKVKRKPELKINGSGHERICRAVSQYNNQVLVLLNPQIIKNTGEKNERYRINC